MDGVIDIHHLHVWAISTSQNALTAHVLIQPHINILNQTLIKKNIKRHLEHLNIQHATIEFETEDENCVDTNTN